MEIARLALSLSILLYLESHQTTSAISVYSEITNSIVNRFNLVCKDFLHRPKFGDALLSVFKGIKYSISLSTRPMGVTTLEEEARRRGQDRGQHRCAQVLMAQYATGQEFAQYTQNNSLHDEFWLIIIDSPMKVTDYLKDANLPYSAEVIAAHVHENKTFADIIDVSRAAIYTPVRLHLLGSWSEQRGLDVSARQLYLRRSNLEGIKLKVGIIENWPVSFQIEGYGVDWEGLFPTIWRHIEQSVNVTTEYITARSTGSFQKNGSWSGLIGMAVRGEIDVIASELTMNALRTEYLDFTRPLISSKTKIYFKASGKDLNWMAALQPFPEGLWRAIFIWVLLCGVFLAFCYYNLAQMGLERHPYPALGVVQFVFYALQALSNQGLEISPRSLTCRIIVLMSYLVSAVVIPAYSASLISSLTTRTPSRAFDTLDEMVADGTYKLLVAQGTAEWDYFANSKDPTFTNAYAKMVEPVPPQLRMKTTRGALRTVCSEPKYALFGIDAITSIRIQHDQNLSCSIISMLRPLSFVNLSMGLRKHHYLSNIIDYYLNEMAEQGATARITDFVWPRVYPPPPQPWVQVSPEEVFQVFILMAAGVLLSCAILVAEIVCHKAWSAHSPVVQFPYTE